MCLDIKIDLKSSETNRWPTEQLSCWLPLGDLRSPSSPCMCMNIAVFHFIIFSKAAAACRCHTCPQLQIWRSVVKQMPLSWAQTVNSRSWPVGLVFSCWFTGGSFWFMAFEGIWIYKFWYIFEFVCFFFKPSVPYLCSKFLLWLLKCVQILCG